jgi:hypothetical protein
MLPDGSEKPIEELRIGDPVLGFKDGIQESRPLEVAYVTNTSCRKAYCYEVETSAGTFIATGDHHWLTPRGRWRKTKHLEGHRMVGISSTAVGLLKRASTVLSPSKDFQIGYVAGISLGDGCYRKVGGKSSYYQLALADFEALVRVKQYLSNLGINVNLTDHRCGGSKSFVSRKPMKRLRTDSESEVSAIVSLLRSDIDSDDYRLGFISGFFDAKGSTSKSVRITNTDESLIERIESYGRVLSIPFYRESDRLGVNTRFSVRLAESAMPKGVLFRSINSAITRKMEPFDLGGLRWKAPIDVLSVRKYSPLTVFNLETTSSTYFANGLASHNCWLPHALSSMDEHRDQKWTEWRDVLNPLQSAVFDFVGGEPILYSGFSDLLKSLSPHHQWAMTSGLHPWNMWEDFLKLGELPNNASLMCSWHPSAGVPIEVFVERVKEIRSVYSRTRASVVRPFIPASDEEFLKASGIDIAVNSFEDHTQLMRDDYPKLCDGGITHFVINNNGDIYPCATTMQRADRDKYRLGNLFTDGLITRERTPCSLYCGFCYLQGNNPFRINIRRLG